MRRVSPSNCSVSSFASSISATRSFSPPRPSPSLIRVAASMAHDCICSAPSKARCADSTPTSSTYGSCTPGIPGHPWMKPSLPSTKQYRAARSDTSASRTTPVGRPHGPQLGRSPCRVEPRSSPPRWSTPYSNAALNARSCRRRSRSASGSCRGHPWVAECSRASIDTARPPTLAVAMPTQPRGSRCIRTNDAVGS